MKSEVKALFVGSLEQEGCSGGQRLWALRENGVTVAVLDKSRFRKKQSRWQGLLAKALQQPQMLWQAEALRDEFLKQCRDFKPDLVWIEWPREFSRSTLEAARKLLPEATFLSMQDDNPWGLRAGDKWMWRSYFSIVPLFDLHLIKRVEDAANLKVLGATACRLWQHGVYPPLFYPKPDTEKIYPLSFVGTCMDGRDELIGALLEAGIEIHVFGTHWEKRSKLPQQFPGNFHPAVRGEAYAEVIRQSQVCLGLVSKSNQDEWTMRSYEVPGCGGLLLAERTPTHETMFVEGLEATFFSSPAECIQKIRLLLQDLPQCKVLGEAARKRFIEQGWTLEGRMRDLLNEIAGRSGKTELNR